MKTPIVIYTPYPSSAPGAAGMRVHFLEEALKEEGIAFRTITPSDASGLRLLFLLLKLRPHTIISTSPPLPPNFWVWAASACMRSKWVLDAKDDGRAILLKQKKNPSLRERIFLGLRSFLYHQASTTWFLTPHDRDEATREIGVDSAKTKLVPNGVDARIRFDAHARKSTRKRFRIPPQMRVGVYAGSLGDEEIMPFLEGLEKYVVDKDFFLFMIISTDHSTADKKRMHETIEHAQTCMGKKRLHVETNVPAHAMTEWLSAADIGFIPWPDKFPTSLPVKAFDYVGTGLQVLAKCPKNGALDEWIQSHKKIGKTTHSWEAFLRGLREMDAEPILNSRQRTQLAESAHKEMSRMEIMRQAIHLITEKGEKQTVHKR